MRAGLVDPFQQLASYPWSGHDELMGKVRYEWMDSDYVLQFFGSRAEAAKKAYLEFLEEEMNIDREKELSGGGLLRSQGGWSRVCSMWKRGEKALSDEKILGGDDFVRDLLKQAEERQDVLLPESERLEQFRDAIKKGLRVSRGHGCLSAVW